MISHRNGIAYLSHKNNTRMIRGSYTTPSKSLANDLGIRGITIIHNISEISWWTISFVSSFLSASV